MHWLIGMPNLKRSLGRKIGRDSNGISGKSGSESLVMKKGHIARNRGYLLRSSILLILWILSFINFSYSFRLYFLAKCSIVARGGI